MAAARLDFQEGPIFANLVLADEINRATPKTQAALLEAMQEHRHGRQPGIPLAAPFFVLATQNPLEMEGTYPLPEAQLDRFLFKLNVPFPSAEDLIDGLWTARPAPTVRPSKVAPLRDCAMQQLAREVPIASHVSAYAVRWSCRDHPGTAAP